MDKTLEEKLTAFGCAELEETAERFLGDTEFYLSILSDMVSDSSFDNLKKTLKTGNAKEAFENAHLLKGMLGNCGISPMYKTICNIVELLRKNRLEGLATQYDILEKQRDELTEIILEMKK